MTSTGWSWQVFGGFSFGIFLLFKKQLPGLTKKNRPQRSAFQAWRYQLIANVYQRISWRRMSRGGPEKRCFCVSPKSLSIETRVLRKDGNAPVFVASRRKIPLVKPFYFRKLIWSNDFRFSKKFLTPSIGW